MAYEEEKKKFVKPTVEEVVLKPVDVICTSPGDEHDDEGLPFIE